MRVNSRIDRERQTIKAMVDLYCLENHGSDTLCEDCSSLMDYVILRLEQCPFKENKPTCVNCTVHCYASVKRNQVRNVMRFSGPQMIFKHTIMTMLHMWDGIKYKPIKKRAV